MTYDIQLNLPAQWQKEQSTYIDESEFEITHVEAHLLHGKEEEAMVDIYVGEMPEDTNAEDQAYSNYVDMVGFSDDDPDDYEPIFKVKFNSKPAYGFNALCENDAPMLLLTQEVRQGVLLVMCIAATDEIKLEETVALVERTLRIK
ncbi:MAG: hypothetical protein MJY84_00955 [Bacteroidales bacterium]|nr:hypothetical protein [Bacteroidales bacterium]